MSGRTFRELRAQVAELIGRSVTSQEGIVTLLRLKARFSPYSLTNAVAIQLQNPAAQHVAAYHEWHSLGYRVTGQSSVKLWRPVQRACFDRGGVPTDARDATPEERAAILSGAIKTEQRVSCRVSLVYDIAQTDCPPRDYERVMGTPYLHLGRGELYTCLCAMSEQLGFPVVQDGEGAAALAKGFYDGGRIHVSSRIHPTWRAAALADGISRALVAQSSVQSAGAQRFESFALSFLLQARLGLPEPDRCGEDAGAALGREWIARRPEEFDGCLGRVQRMHTMLDTRLQETVKELGLGFDQAREQPMSRAQREVNRNFMQDIE